MEKFTSIEESLKYKKTLEEKAKGVEILSILIATTKDRRLMFNMLIQEFHKQIDEAGFKGQGFEKWAIEVINRDNDGKIIFGEDGKSTVTVYNDGFKHPDKVELVFIEDSKEMSIGAKRQKLLEKAKGKYIVFFDSDDMPRPEYIREILQVIEQEPDCIGFKIHMTTNGKDPVTCIHSLRNPEWVYQEGQYLRNVTHFNPVRKELALQVGFPDLRFGEDKVYSDAVSKLCKNEIFIDKFLFDYRYSTAEEHGKKYGYNHSNK